MAGRLAVALMAVLATGCDNPKEQLRQDYAWKTACELTQYPCENIPQPKVDYSPAAGWDQAWGLYGGGDTIVVDDDLEGTPDSVIIMVHEFVHYLQLWHDLEPANPTKWDVCFLEYEATLFGWETAVRMNLRHSPVASTWAEVKDAYGCP